MTKTNSKTILIVEDEEPLQKILSDCFKREGFKILSACDGKDGLKQAVTKHPDLILLDVIMPLMDGITMLEELRKKEKDNHIPVIILTNLSSNDRAAMARGHGVYDYLIKTDWKLEDLVKKVKQKLYAENK